jgi:tRNA modification GTPase
MPHFNDTIAALATPAGTSAIAVLRVSGLESAKLAQDIFGETPPPRVARRGDYHERRGALLDDVLFTFFLGPNSYTGEDSLEISCHGNPFIAQKILEDLFARNCRPAEPGEFTQRAFLNGRMDLSQAEAVMDLISARSERALAAANQQLRGALGKRMNSLVAGLLDVLARIEAHIDFPEEDLPPEDRGCLERELARLINETDRLLATSHYGAILRGGIKTVIVGPPNVGKSSLLNRLVGRERALVSAEPGTTRDFIEEQILIGPYGLRIIDTAGLNSSPTPLEKLGMAKTLDCVAEADLLLLVMDASQPVVEIPPVLAEIKTPESRVIVLNKSDLIIDSTVAPSKTNCIPLVRVSALTGFGIQSLAEAIVSQVDIFQESFDKDFIAINSRHANALENAKAWLADAQKKLADDMPSELIASDLRGVLAAYGEISGKIDNENVLDRIFASFCIGK